MNGRRKRGTRRVLFCLRLAVWREQEGPDTQFLAETVNVNREGAKIKTAAHLAVESRICVNAMEPPRTTLARVVWARPDIGEYGIELQTPGNFWGIVFPPDDWEEPSAILSVMLGNAGQDSTPSAEAPLPVPMPVLPTEGAQAVVSGMSAVRMPFQETGRLVPISEREATILVRPSVIPGTSLRVILDNQIFIARIRAISSEREQGRWRVWVRFN